MSARLTLSQDPHTCRRLDMSTAARDLIAAVHVGKCVRELEGRAVITGHRASHTEIRTGPQPVGRLQYKPIAVQYEVGASQEHRRVAVGIVSPYWPIAGSDAMPYCVLTETNRKSGTL